VHIEVSEIIRSRRRTIAVEVHEDASVTVRAPGWVSMKFIKKFIDEKKAWILKKQEEARESIRRRPVRNFEEGEEFFYLGKTYKLRLVGDQRQPLTLNRHFMLSERYSDKGREVFTDWYREEAERIIPKRAGIVSAMSGLEYKRLNITHARRRWGSCNESGNINFSMFLVMAPLRVIDYVVAHEISHLSELNHSENFWGMVGSLIPDYEAQKRWLKENEHLLVF
jgi:predicted metal-dependent hydrolase